MSLLDLSDGETLSFRALSFEVDPAFTIRPAHKPEGKVVRAIRVHVDPADKPDFPHYYDLTAAKLVAQMEPQLKERDLARARFKLTAQGFGPKKSFSVDVLPLG